MYTSHNVNDIHKLTQSSYIGAIIWRGRDTNNACRWPINTNFYSSDIGTQPLKFAFLPCMYSKSFPCCKWNLISEWRRSRHNPKPKKATVNEKKKKTA